jgi:Domain of unknown function (DUF1906)
MPHAQLNSGGTGEGSRADNPCCGLDVRGQFATGRRHRQPQHNLDRRVEREWTGARIPLPESVVGVVNRKGMIMLGLDYSGGRPSGAAVARAGYGFVVRYLVNGLSGRVDLSADEVSDMHANGVAVVLTWERKIIGQPDRVTEGHGAGVADAQAAVAQANAVGLPDNPIYFCVDFDMPDYSPGNASARAKLGPVGDYFEGVLSVLPRDRVGVYGGIFAVSRTLDAGLAQWAWQTAAWSGGQEDPRIHLFQRVGTVTVDRVDCDVNEARKDDFGQQGDTMTPEELLDLPINRAGSETGVTSLRQIVAWFDSDLNGLKAELGKQLDAIKSEVEQKIAAIGTPAIDYDLLAAKIAAQLHLNGAAVIDSAKTDG